MKYRLVVVCILWLTLTTRAQRWTSGTIVNWQGDSIKVAMLVDKKAKVDRYFSHIDVIIRDDSNQTDTLSAADIAVYEKEGVVYASIKNFDTSVKSDFFLREIISGTQSALYLSWSKINEEGRDIYYFKKSGQDWDTMDVESGIVSVREISNTDYPKPIMNVDSEKHLRNFFMHYFSGCDAVVRVLKSEFYSASDIESLFKCYVSNCDQ